MLRFLRRSEHLFYAHLASSFRLWTRFCCPLTASDRRLGAQTLLSGVLDQLCMFCAARKWCRYASTNENCSLSPLSLLLERKNLRFQVCIALDSHDGCLFPTIWLGFGSNLDNAIDCWIWSAIAWRAQTFGACHPKIRGCHYPLGQRYQID